MPTATDTVSAAQRKMFAKLKIAMPDGSYYIRNGPAGPGDLKNAIDSVGRGEQAGDSGNAIRVHIMARAKALKLSDKIPDTWQSDGSLKHADLEEFLAHHGIKGMRWGVRRGGSVEEERSGTSNRVKAKADDLEAKAKDHEAKAAKNAATANKAKADDEDLLKRGLQSDVFKRVYGDDAYKKSDWEFYGKTGKSRAQALQETHGQLAHLHNVNALAANHHTRVAKKLRDKKERLEHSGFDTGTDEFLEHFGVKGMRWGSRKSGPVGEHSEDSARTRESLAKVKTARGTHTLTNDELKKLNERLNLEANYKRLTESEEVVKGEKFVTDLLKNAGKQEAQKLTNQAVDEGAKWLIKQGGKHAAKHIFKKETKA